jgi:phosphatidylethanolamine/phosphatidyl-N-methylethanolamine N-methyltransferase
MAGELDKDTIARAYARWAPIYDLVFGVVFDPGRKASIAAAHRIGGRILDVGVGTGISLADYSRAQPVGVDYSEAMLRKARNRVQEHKLTNVELLAVMDSSISDSRCRLRRGGGAVRDHRGARPGSHPRRVRA